MKFSLIVPPMWEASAQSSGHALVHLAYGLGDQTQLYLTAGGSGQGGLMGLCDDVLPEAGMPEEFAVQVLETCRHRHYTGVLADFERPVSRRSLEVLSALQAVLAAHELELLVPEAYGPNLAKARVLICSALSGGQLWEHLQEARSRYGGRAVLELRRLQTVFPLPCPTGEGTPVSDSELNAALAVWNGYYSEALGCNYVRAPWSSPPQLILYDTPGTLSRKLYLAEELGYCDGVALYPEVRELPIFSGGTG